MGLASGGMAGFQNMDFGEEESTNEALNQASYSKTQPEEQNQEVVESEMTEEERIRQQEMMIQKKLQQAMEEEERLQKQVILNKKKKVRSMIAKKVARDKKNKLEMERVMNLKMKQDIEKKEPALSWILEINLDCILSF